MIRLEEFTSIMIHVFGNQFDDVNNKCRLIRRKIVTIGVLQELIKNINVVPRSISEMLADLDDDSIPRVIYLLHNSICYE